MTNRYDRIRDVLEAAFAPVVLEIVDDSAKHASHAARNGVAGGETHYRVRMVSEALAGQSRVSRSRAVHEALAAEFSAGLHALSLTLLTPEEAGA
jgi:BolA family transcriptional regulator, general stress-responsive regulator